MMKKRELRDIEDKTKMKKKITKGIQAIFVIMLFMIGISLIFLKPIRNQIIHEKSKNYSVTKLTPKQIEKNEEKPVSYDFSAVEPVSSEDIIGNQVTDTIDSLTQGSTNHNRKDNLPTIGGISIPDLSINLPIFKGVDNTSLLYGAGTMKENQVMGGENNYALASHHVFGLAGSSKELFSPLEHAKVGQKIYITNLTTVYEYTITNVQNIQPTDVQVIDDQEGKSLITLITCDDLQATGRIMVQGELTHTSSYDTDSSYFTGNYNQ